MTYLMLFTLCMKSMDRVPLRFFSSTAPLTESRRTKVVQQMLISTKPMPQSSGCKNDVSFAQIPAQSGPRTRGRVRLGLGGVFGDSQFEHSFVRYVRSFVFTISVSVSVRLPLARNRHASSTLYTCDLSANGFPSVISAAYRNAAIYNGSHHRK